MNYILFQIIARIRISNVLMNARAISWNITLVRIQTSQETSCYVHYQKSVDAQNTLKRRAQPMLQ